MGANRPTIVHVVNTLEGGGTEHVLTSLLRAFDPAKFRHVVVTLRKAGAPAATLPDHIACRPLDACGRDRLVFLRLAEVLIQERAALVHARNTGCWLDALAACVLRPRTALVFGFHGLQTSRGFSAGHRRLARWGKRLGVRFTSVSHSGQGQIAGECGVSPERIVVIPNGVDIERHSPRDPDLRATARAELGFDESTFVIGAVGALIPIKRFDLLIDALADLRQRHPQARLLVVGDGPLRSDLARRAEQKGIQKHICLVGQREDVPSLLQAMDAYVCSSDSEGMSNSLLEAMAAGLPVVSTDVGDHALVVRDGRDGFVVHPGDWMAVAERISRWINDPESAARHGACARARAGRFDFMRTVVAYEDFYAGLVSRQRAAVANSARVDVRTSAVGRFGLSADRSA